MAKLLVIGGGPAGLYAASEAAKCGFDVTLCEKGRIGENIRCAEGFFDTLKLLGKPDFGVLYKVENLIMKVKSTYKISTNQLNLWMIDRATWQKKLAEQAKNIGVRIWENSPVRPEDLARLKKDYDFIIDASGAPSVTSRLYGFLQFYKANSARTVQYTLEGDFSHLEGSIKVGLLPDLWGYYWIFPKTKKIANVGVGNFNPHEKDRLWDRLERVLSDENLRDCRVITKIGGLCPTVIPDKLVIDNILLVGDAAGLTSPLHGGGIDMAVLSAKEAVKSIVSDWSNYDKNLKALFGKKLKFEGLLVKIWQERNLDEMDKLIANLSKCSIYQLLAHPKLINSVSLQILEKAFLKGQHALTKKVL